MKYELKPFQAKALAEMLEEAFDAQGKYERSGKPQVISLTAPTGAGKTIIATSFIEDVLRGNENYVEHPDTIFIWLSDSPELNEQSKMKIENTADRLNFGQCVTIEADSFNQEYLEEGYIYFLNTQKLAKNNNLVKGGDGRDYTIWETLQNTIDEKSDRLFLIIDEAHRGAKEKKAKEAITIMQKFIKGSKPDGLSPFPVVIGMSATIDRFNNLVRNANSTIRPINISPAAVRGSGLLKDEIIILYPEDITARVDMAVLQAATDDWKKKCDHWEIFYDKQKTRKVNPVFLIQVENGSAGRISNTDLDEVVRTVEERLGYSFDEGEIVHAFGEKADIPINGKTVRYEEPSRIEDDKNVRIVLYKESLSTGWDCPRAETMMSFRRAVGADHIAQLLGRMLRTPLQQRVATDEYLNSVYLFLPYFDKETVEDVIKALRDEEDGSLPTEVHGDGIGKFSPLTALPRKKDVSKKPPVDVPNPDTSQEKNPTDNGPEDKTPTPVTYGPSSSISVPSVHEGAEQATVPEPDAPSMMDSEPGHETPAFPAPATVEADDAKDIDDTETEDIYDTIDRLGIIDYINALGIQSYEVRKDKINDYLKSLFMLSGFLSQTGLYEKAVEDVKNDIVEMIHNYIERLKAAGTYEGELQRIMEFTLSAQTFDVFGEKLTKDVQRDLLSTTDTDIDRQFKLAEKKLKNEGVGKKYVYAYYDQDRLAELKIDVIMYVDDIECMDKLMTYAESKYHSYIDSYRSKVKTLEEKHRSRYRSIVNDGDPVSSHDFYLPQTIDGYPSSANGVIYTDHLYVDEQTRSVKIKLNGWEEGLLKEEAKRDDFVCWLRNPDRRSWSLCIPYEKDNHYERMFPDFLIVRENDNQDYFVDILEPHDPSRTDNMGKAKGLADYAKTYDFGRVQLIRKMKSPTGEDRFKRLDMSRSEVRTHVRNISSNDELDHIFDNYGFYE